jgi:hypothetical protein
MRNQLLYAIAFCGLLTTTHMTMTMDLSLNGTPEPSPKSSPRGSQSRSNSISPRDDYDDTDSMTILDIKKLDNKDAGELAKLIVDLNAISRCTVTGLEPKKTSPQISPRSSQFGSQSHSPRKQEISDVLGGEKQQNDRVPTATVFFTNNPDVSANCDYVNSRNIQGTSQSKITFQNKFGTQRTVIAECTGEYNQENFIVIEEKVGDTTIKSTINMNPDHSQEIKSSDISKKENLEKEIIDLDDTKNSTQLNVAIVDLKLDKPEEEPYKKEFQKRAQQNKRVTIVMKRIIGISAFTAIIMAILYKYDQLPQTFINALNKILPQNYAI